MDIMTYNNKSWDFGGTSKTSYDSPNQPFWMVVRIGGNGYNKEDSMPSRHHETYECARIEAERLARKHPNHERGFAVVKTECIVIGKVDVTEITWGDAKEEARISKLLKTCKVSLDALTHPMSGKEWMEKCEKADIPKRTHENHKKALREEGLVILDEDKGLWKKL